MFRFVIHLTSEHSFTYTLDMSQREHIIATSYEIERLNQIIDRKIIKGQSYRVEAKRHLKLLKLLKKDTEQSRFGRLLSFISIF